MVGVWKEGTCLFDSNLHFNRSSITQLLQVMQGQSLQLLKNLWFNLTNLLQIRRLSYKPHWKNLLFLHIWLKRAIPHPSTKLQISSVQDVSKNPQKQCFYYYPFFPSKLFSKRLSKLHGRED